MVSEDSLALQNQLRNGHHIGTCEIAHATLKKHFLGHVQRVSNLDKCLMPMPIAAQILQRSIEGMRISVHLYHLTNKQTGEPERHLAPKQYRPAPRA